MTTIGVKWVSNNTSPTLTRMGATAGMTVAQAIAYCNCTYPWSQTRRCNLLDNGVVSAWYNGGAGCYSDTDVATRGQVMVYVPAFYQYIDTTNAADGTTPRVVYWISNALGDVITNEDATTHTIVAGDIHPAFLVDGVAKSCGYIGAFEAYQNGSLLESKAGVVPTGSTAMGTYRTAAESRGTGWELATIQLLGALKSLFIVEYASLNSHLSLGYGNDYSTSTIINTGSTALYGNASLGNTILTTNPMSYRGVENLWGNTDTITEGVNIAVTTGEVWVAPQTRLHTYTCNGAPAISAPYVDTSVALPAASWGYISSVSTGAYGWAFIPTAAAGNNITYFCDTTRDNTGYQMIVLSGGPASNHQSGLFELNAYNNLCASAAQAYIGTRLCYLPA